MAEKESKRGPGRPSRPVVTLPAEAEEIARRFFDNAKPPQADRVAEDSKPYKIVRKGKRGE